MNFDLVTQLAIIAEEESAAVYHFTLLTVSATVVLLAILLVAKLVPDSFFKRCFWRLLAFAVLVAVVWAVPKPWVPRVTWPEGVTDNGSTIDTNTWAAIEFKWNLRESYPPETPLEFYRKPTTGVGDWAAMGVEPAGSRHRLFTFGTAELPDNPTNYIYKIVSSYVPPALPSIELVSTTASNVTIKVTAATNYFGCAAVWEARRQIWPDTRLPLWGPWTEIGSGFFFDASETNRVVTGEFVNGRRNTEIRLKMAISDEASNGVRP